MRDFCSCNTTDIYPLASDGQHSADEHPVRHQLEPCVLESRRLHGSEDVKRVTENKIIKLSTKIYKFSTFKIINLTLKHQHRV